MNDYIIFTSDSYGYALDVSKVERIDQIPELTPLPNAHPFIEGIMTYRSQTLKVINFRHLIDASFHDEEIQGGKLLIYHDDKGLFGIKVDGIEDICAFDDSVIKSYTHEVKVGLCLHTRGVVEYQKRLIIVVDSVELPHDEAV